MNDFASFSAIKAVMSVSFPPDIKFLSSFAYYTMEWNFLGVIVALF